MNGRLTGILFAAVGVLAVSASVLGFFRDEVWFLGRSRSGLTLIDHSGAPALYWFVVIFYLAGGAVFLVWGVRTLRHNDMRL